MKTTFCLLITFFVCQSSVLSTEVTELKVETTYLPENCDRQAKRGDMLSMHYRGSLVSDGSVFDSR